MLEEAPANVVSNLVDHTGIIEPLERCFAPQAISY